MSCPPKGDLTSRRCPATAFAGTVTKSLRITGGAAAVGAAVGGGRDARGGGGDEAGEGEGEGEGGGEDGGGEAAKAAAADGAASAATGAADGAAKVAMAVAGRVVNGVVEADVTSTAAAGGEIRSEDSAAIAVAASEVDGKVDCVVVAETASTAARLGVLVPFTLWRRQPRAGLCPVKTHVFPSDHTMPVPFQVPVACAAPPLGEKSTLRVLPDDVASRVHGRPLSSAPCTERLDALPLMERGQPGCPRSE